MCHHKEFEKLLGDNMIDTYDVIYVDDEHTMTTIFSQVVGLKFSRWRVAVFNDSDQLYQLINTHKISSTVWIIDLKMPDKNGVEIGQAIRASGDNSATLIGFTALDLQALSRSPEYQSALDIFSRMIGKQEGFIKPLTTLENTVLRRVKM